MSRRTAEASKAIRLAWQKEYELVQQGKGTRDWTEEQQRDILNPELGKAYDENGKAFEGHHMKSAETYPEYQGDSDNIKFLSRTEHTQAHGGWRKPTNGYYDYITGLTYDFEENGLTPCKVITLSNPVVSLEMPSVDAETSNLGETQLEQGSETGPPIRTSKKSTVKPQSTTKDSSTRKKIKKVATTKTKGERGFKRFVNGAGKIAHNAGKFALEHKEEIIGIAITVGSAIWAVISSTDGNSVGEKLDAQSDDNLNYCSSANKMEYHCTGNLSGAERVSPREHEVQRHSQRYHTKEGTVIRDKESYQRGGEKEG